MSSVRLKCCRSVAAVCRPHRFGNRIDIPSFGFPSFGDALQRERMQRRSNNSFVEIEAYTNLSSGVTGKAVVLPELEARKGPS